MATNNNIASANKRIVSMYDNVGQGSQSYMSDLMGYIQNSPREAQHVLNMRDKARQNNNLDQIPDKLNDTEQQLNISIADSERHAKDDELQKVNELMKSDDIIDAYERNNTTRDGFNPYHVDSMSSHRADNEAEKTVAENYNPSMATPNSSQSTQIDNSNNNLFETYDSQEPRDVQHKAENRGFANRNKPFKANDGKNLYGAKSKNNVQAAKLGKDIYAGLTKQGQNYFNANMALGKHSPALLNRMKVTPANKLGVTEQINQKYLTEASRGVPFKKGHLDFDHPLNALSTVEQRKIDDYFNSTGGMSALKNKTLATSIKGYHTEQKLKDLNRKSQALDPMAQEKTIGKGMNLYANLTPAGQNLFTKNTLLANSYRKSFNKFKNTDYGHLTGKQRGIYDSLKRIENGTHRVKGGKEIDDPNMKVDPKEVKAINRYFKSGSVPSVAHRLTNGVHSYNMKQYVDGNPSNSILSGKPTVSTNYKEKNHERYNQMLSNGAKLYDSLSQQGRRYLFTASQEATKNLDDFKAVQNGDPNVLTPKQLKMKRNLQNASGWGKTDNGQAIQLTPSMQGVKNSSVNRDEKAQIDKFLNNKVTQEGLSKGDTYSLIMARNIKNRQVQEEEDELNKLDNDAPDKKMERRIRHGSALTERIHRNHPFAFAFGYTLAGGTDNAIEHISEKAKAFARNQKRNGHRPDKTNAFNHKNNKHPTSARKKLSDFFARSNKRLSKRTASHHHTSTFGHSSGHQQTSGPTR